jgi:hypothetical protein
MPTDLPPRRPQPERNDLWHELLLTLAAGVFLAFLMMAFLAAFGGGAPMRVVGP